MGQNWDDGGRNENSSQRVNSAIFGSDLNFFHCHIICQNLSLERSNDIFILYSRNTSGPLAELNNGDLTKEPSTSLFRAWRIALGRALQTGKDESVKRILE